MTTDHPDHPELAFTAPLEKDGAFDTFLTVPRSVQHLGTGKAVKVEGTLDGTAFEATLMPSGQRGHWLPLRKALRQQIGKDAAGDTVHVRLRRRG
ncbi:DUF1905 domain-containing protein [Nakamurella leprariae]|uniref:DUF1905 domain-containing protein n=1 Tax=Nakamurella leprariae TaxID=2803911 RepID=A0A938YGH8_9ACTN|nr:DUF1905 domain-containing protein [Nakamurella leprariae]MBM9469086.1 DUF1905 domain-containing protein [Nakamurella leprariae]